MSLLLEQMFICTVLAQAVLLTKKQLTYQECAHLFTNLRLTAMDQNGFSKIILLTFIKQGMVSKSITVKRLRTILEK